MDEQMSLSHRLLPEMKEAGSHQELEGFLPLECLFRGSQLFKLNEGISYKVDLINTGGGVVLRGFARGIGTTECARCLEEAAFDVKGAVEGYFILNPSEQEIEQSDDEFTAVPANGIIDLKPPILAAIVYELPQVSLCKEDCAGLCQVCGANLNMTTCECEKEPNPDSPFAVLKDLIEPS